MSGPISYPLLVSTSLGLLLSLAWSQAVAQVVHSAFPPPDAGAEARAMVRYALVVTVLVVIAVAVFNRAHCALVKGPAPPKEGASVPAGDGSARGPAGGPIVRLLAH